MPRRLALAQDALQARFYELTRQWHPDKFARKSESERQNALDLSSALNDAYRTLRDPIKRAEYVLKLEGFHIGEQGSKDVPPELLEEVFELNMALEDLRSGDESAKAQLEQARNNFVKMLSKIDALLATESAQYDGPPADSHSSQETLSKIRILLNRRKYIHNLVEQVPEPSPS